MLDGSRGRADDPRSSRATTNRRAGGRRRRLGALVAVLVTTAVLPRGPVEAQSDPAGTTTTTAGASTTAADEPVDLATTLPVETPGVDAVLDATEVTTTPALRRADDALTAAIADQQEMSLRLIDAQRKRQELALGSLEADRQVAEAERTLAAAQQQLAADEAELAARRRTEKRLRAALAVEQDRLREMAARLLASAPDDAYAVLGTFDDFTEADRRDAARDRGVELQSDAVEDARTPWEEARARRRDQAERTDESTAAAADALDALAEARDVRDHATERLAEAERATTAAQAAYDDTRDRSADALAGRREARLLSEVEGAPLTLVALHAYWRAAQLAPCRVPWWVLAGVGRVESRHGTAFGATVTAAGDTTVHIIGIPLDGRPGTAAIRDTDGGRLDGDATWDRAVGPMQFLPGTWARLGRDGNGDGTPDPHNLYDAATAAAGLLCLGGGDLLTEGAQRAALLRYNRSVPYGSKVLAEGGGYRDALELPELPPRPGD